MTTLYGVQAALGNLPGQNNVMPTEFGGQVRLAHDYFTIGSGQTASTIVPGDVVSLNSILIPASSRILGGFMTCEELSSGTPADAGIDIGTAAQMAAGGAGTIQLRYGTSSLLDVILDDDSLNSNYHALTAFGAGTDDVYTSKTSVPFYAWIWPHATSADWNQTAASCAVGIYYVSD